MIYLKELKQFAGQPAISALEVGGYIAVFLPELIAALKVAELVRDEDWLSERISDSLDVDWSPIDCARAITAGLGADTK